MVLSSKRLLSLYDRSPIFLQDVFSSAFGLIKLVDERGPAFQRILHELKESQWWSNARLRELQVQRLRSILRFAQEHVPFYRKRFAEHGVSWDQVQSVDDLKRFPIVTKEDVRAHKVDMVPRLKRMPNVVVQSTSGTTGMPLEVLLTRETYLSEKAWIMRHHSWGGYNNRYWRATFGGHRMVPIEQERPPFWRYNYLWRQIRFSTFHMSERNLRLYAEILRQNNVRFVDGYPSSLYIMARYLLSVGQTIPMKAVFTGAEPLYDTYREAIESAFCCKAFDYYGLAEKVISAGECEHHTGLHVSMEHVVAEIVPPEGPVSETNGAGELVGTSLVNKAMPLIRYRTGDIIGRAPERCGCGRGLQLIGHVETKRGDMIICADGRHVSAPSLTYPVRLVPAIDECQIVQESPAEVVVRVVRRPEYTAEDETHLLDGLRGRFGPSTKVRAEYVDEIPRTATGKFRFVVSNVSSNLVTPLKEE